MPRQRHRLFFLTMLFFLISGGTWRAWGQETLRGNGFKEAPSKIQTAKPNPKIGMNFAGPMDYASEMPFVDVFRYSRPWISQAPGQPWGKGPPLSLDENGWVKRLNPGCWAETPLCTIEGGHYPSGIYTVLFEGKGNVTLNGAAEVRIRQPGRLRVAVDAKKGGFFLAIRETDPRDPVRNIRVIMPGHETSFHGEPWNPAFLKLWKGVDCVRFMDFMLTNNSKIQKWAERPTLETATFSEKGVPLTLMIDLANRLECNAWFCMPHLADDEFVCNFALAVKAKIHPKAKIYIEYSNEVWNRMFAQNRHALAKGREVRLGARDHDATWIYTAHRSLEIFAIWENVFGTERLVRVLPTQVVNTYISENILKYNDAGKKADAIAIAPYISLNVGPKTKPSVDEVSKWSVDQLLDHVEKEALPESKKWIQVNKKLADQYGLKLLAYEGGQHLSGIQGGENNEALTKLFRAANASPRMGTIYEKHLDDWVNEGGDLFCNFSSMSVWTKWGSWGLLQYMDEDPRRSPKFQAVMGRAKALGQPVDLPQP